MLSKAPELMLIGELVETLEGNSFILPDDLIDVNASLLSQTEFDCWREDVTKTNSIKLMF